MSKVYVSIGSNINRYQHIAASLDALFQHFGELEISPVYESETIGFKGDHFLNLVAAFSSALSVGDLSTLLRKIEHDNGRTREGPRFSSRSLDIDILTYDSMVGNIDGVSLPRAEIIENAFVLRPLADIAANQLHPKLKQSYSELWQAYDQASQKLWPIDFKWQDRIISNAI